MKLLFLIFLIAVVAGAQSTPPRRDIPAIAKAANGAIVSIIMSNKGSPLAQGSGFLISKDGIIVTNYHVIETGDSAIVKLPDGAVFPVDGVLAADKVRDLAIIKTHGRNFRTLTLGNSDQIQVGEEVVAIGNPLSLESTVSNGIVSGIRTVEEEGGKFLQVTAPISPGSSGGPLLDMVGEVVGITTLFLRDGENLNFAIPINDAKRLLLAKSSKIRALPNESEPAKAQTHDAGSRGLATLSQQKMCSEQAEMKFNDYKKNPLVSDSAYTSHYDATAGICYMEITNRMWYEGKVILYNRFIHDAFEGRSYGAFVSPAFNSTKPQLCYIQPPGQPEITCNSDKEFSDLALQYFGTGPD